MLILLLSIEIKWKLPNGPSAKLKRRDEKQRKNVPAPKQPEYGFRKIQRIDQ
jgi:hypothetical protein